MCEYCGRGFGCDSSFISKSLFLITRVNFNVLIWVLTVLSASHLCLYIVALTRKTTVSLAKDGKLLFLLINNLNRKDEANRNIRVLKLRMITYKEGNEKLIVKLIYNHWWKVVPVFNYALRHEDVELWGSGKCSSALDGGERSSPRPAALPAG
jgi:hypothetical protein